jgi:hypothetical protein
MSSEAFNVAGWVKNACTTPSSNIIVCSAATIAQYIFEQTAIPFNVVIGETWLMRYRVQYIDIQYVQVTGSTAFGGASSPWCNFDLINGDFTATGCTATMTAVSSGIWDIDIRMTAVAVAKPAGVFALAPSQSATWLQSFVGDGIKSVGVLRYQLENVTGQSDQTASEYVSVGNPPTIGADFITATIVDNGAWTHSGATVTAGGTSGATDSVSYTLSTPTIAGRYYVVTCPNTMPANGFYLDFGSGTGSQVGALSSTNSEVILTCTSAGTVLRVGRWSGSPSGTIGPITVKETVFHGGGADGIKWFATNKDGSAIPDADMDGAHIDPASKTNSLLWCRDLTSSLDTTVRPWVASTTDSELVTNPDFGSDISNWTDGSEVGGSISWDSSGYIALTNGGGTTQEGIAYQAITTVTGNWYTLTVDKVAFNAIVQVATGAGGSNIYQSANTAADVRITFKALSTTTYITLRNFNYSGTATISSVSVKPSGVSLALTGTGIDGLANSCSRLTFKAAGATILQTITTAAVAACSGFWVKRVTGTGTVEFTRDNVTWLDITSSLSTGDFYIAKIENTSVTNPVIGFRGGTVDDVIDVDGGLNHSGTELTLPIFTTTAAVTRNAEPLTYQTSGNFSDTAGTILATFKPTYDTWPAGSIVGKASFGLLASTANSGVQAADGTNTVSGAAGTPAGQRRIGARWSGSSLQAFYENNYGVAGSYDGAFNLTTIGLNTGAAGYIRDIAIFNSSLVDGNIRTAWGLSTEFTTSGALTGQGSLIVGASLKYRVFATSGALIGQGSLIVGSAIYNLILSSTTMTITLADITIELDL